MTEIKHVRKPISWLSTLPTFQKASQLSFPLNGTGYISTLTTLVATKFSFKHACFIMLIVEKNYFINAILKSVSSGEKNPTVSSAQGYQF